MKCPNCTTELQLADRQGVEIDYCPRCRGVWLDRGELDKILDRARGEDDFDDEYRRGPAPSPGGPPNSPGHHPPKKKESFWGQVFDFD